MKRGFVAGAFDLMHAGHCLLLKDCKNYCDYLIVGLHRDPSKERTWKNKPIQTVEERYIQLESNRYVNEIIEYDTEDELVSILINNEINVRFLGTDYLNKDFTGKDLVDLKHIKIIYHDRNHKYSSTELRIRIRDASMNDIKMNLN